MMRYGLGVAALQETRWKGQGELRKRKYSIFNSDGEKPGWRGTGFYINEKVRKSILLFEPINDRICRLKIKGRFQNVTMLSVYAPTEDSDEKAKNKFYDYLTKICDKISRHDILMILGDYNVKIGTEAFTNGVANQINHALVDRRHASSVLDVRSCRGANCHFLIRLKLKQRLSTISEDNKYRRMK